MKRLEFSSVFAKWFFFYVLFVWLMDGILFCGFYLGIPVSGKLAFGGAGILIILMLLVLFLWGVQQKAPGRPFAGFPFRRTDCWKPKGISFTAMVLILYSFCFFFLKALLPDQSTDVLRYHVLLQEPVWRDMIHRDLCPGAMQGFTFSLGDRLFYLFRRLLGYRMGTMWNWLCFLVIVCQIYRLFYRLGWRTGRKAEQRIQIILAFLLAAQYDVLMQFGSYMVEVAAVVILLEGVWFLLGEEPSGAEMAGFTAILGLLITLKVINLLYVIPLLLLYLWKNWERVTVKRFFLCFLAGFLPVSIYMVHNWMITGNPVFPYYNNLFHSPYYMDIHFRDSRWGGRNWQETILWPVSVILFPKYRASEIPAPYTWGYAAAWIGALIYLLGCLRQKKNIAKDFVLLGAVVIGSSLLWSVTSGHMRYYMGGFILLLIWGLDGVRRWLGCAENRQEKTSGQQLGGCQQPDECQQLDGRQRRGRGSTGQKLPALRLGIAAALLFVFLPMPLLSARDCMSGREWSFRMPISTKVLPGGLPGNLDNRAVYQSALKMAGRDHSMGTGEQKQLPQQLVIFDENSMYAVLFQPDLPLISWTTAADMIKAPVYEEISAKLEQDLAQGVKTYCLIQTEPRSLPDLSPVFRNRFAPRQVQYVPQKIFDNRDFYLVQLENPKEPFCDLTRQKAAAVVGMEESRIGTVQTDKEVTLWAGSSGLDAEPVLHETAAWLKQATLQISLEETGQVIREIPLDLTQAGTRTETIPIPELEHSSQFHLTARLVLPKEAEDLSSLAYIWVRTSLSGRQAIGGQEYFLDEAGRIQHGFITRDGKKYYASYYGQIQKGWKNLEDKWYYFSPEDGRMETGWIVLEGKHYYLGEDGVMVTGKQKIDGGEYRFDKNGCLLSDGLVVQD